jgi:hypothetical protein
MLRRATRLPGGYGEGVLVLLGLVLVLAGTFLAILGTLGAIGASLRAYPLPGRRVTPIPKLGGAPTGRRVVVRGRSAAGPGGGYAAPLSGTACVWYLASQTSVRDGRRQTVDRFPAEPFALVDSAGARVLVGPRCPALEQIAPSAREVRSQPHPWFDEAVNGDEVEVFEFVVAEGTELVASGELSRSADGSPHLGGEVALSAAPEAAAGDPARARLRRDMVSAFGGWALVIAGALIL